NEAFLKELKSLSLPYISIENTNYVYIIPTQINSIARDSLPIQKLLNKYGHPEQAMNIQYFFKKQENRYVKLITDANPLIAQDIKDLKLLYYQTRNTSKIPLLHSIGLEEYTRRYYQYGSFLSNVLGMVDKNGNAFYGVEQYFDSLLRGKNGKIIGRSSSWVGNVGANDFQIEDVINGNNIYLTIDLGIQKEIENVAKRYQESLRADSVSILVYDPNDGSIKASANYPSFDPNDFNTTFELTPLDWKDKYILDDLTYLDVPVYTYTGGTYSLAKTYERTDPTIPKYLAQNMYGPRVFVDRNIAMPYEPGSIFKAFTMGIALDVDEISLYDLYTDTNEAKVGQYTIKNADPKNCIGTNSFLHAFIYSCNVGMVKIVNGDVNSKVFGVGKESYYNYLDKLGFGKLTNIELAGESEGFVDNASTVSVSRFLNNAFGQGILTTPIQIAAAYTPLVNSGYYLQPTIVKSIFDTKTNTSIENKKKVIAEIFRPTTSTLLKQSLFSVLDQNKELKVAQIPGYRVGGKSGTSQISYKGRYQQGIGWTNASFVGVLPAENPKYIVVVQVRRPRSSIWGSATAAKIFGEVGKFLVNYSLISK
ncbi:MAG: penicillin-binding protein 2, partial [Candidatus Absconditabacteria bacterium]